MEKRKKETIIGIASVIGGLAMGFFSKSGVGKTAGFGLATAGLGYMAYSRYKIEKKEIESCLDDISDLYNKSGIDPEVLETNILVPEEEEVEDVPEEDIKTSSEILYTEMYESSVFEDDILIPMFVNNKLTWKYENTLHVLTGDNGKLIIGIPIPRTNKKTFTVSDMENHFIGILGDFIEKYELDMDLPKNREDETYLNKLGIEITSINSEGENDGYTYYNEIEREIVKVLEDGTKIPESWGKYYSKINNYLNSYESDKDFTDEANSKGILGYQEYFMIEFPLQRQNSDMVGLTTLTSTILIKELMSPMEIMSSTGKKINFEFSHIAFHPDDSFDFLYTIQGGKLDKISL